MLRKYWNNQQTESDKQVNEVGKRIDTIPPEQATLIRTYQEPRAKSITPDNKRD